MVDLVVTTTIEDSGFLAALLDAFRRDHPAIRLRALTAPTGRALALGRAGDADVLITHAPAAESAFVAAGHGTRRIPLMRNRFIIAGPATDPAGIRAMPTALAAMARIASAGATFVSRGDGSGTHRRELALWRAAGFDPRGLPAAGSRSRAGRAAARPAASPSGRDFDGGWYLRAGAGMAGALRLANARRAYILTDMATFLNLGDRLELEALVRGGAGLVNRYAVVPVTGAHGEAARTFVAWITGPPGHAVIRGYGVERFGRALFTPAGGAGARE